MKWNKVVPSNAATVVNTFDKTGIKTPIVKEHVDLVWAETQHRSAVDKSPKYFGNFGTTKHVDNARLTLVRNTRRLKH
eukprot:7099129-Ditylum_brightwellii.AAC.1